MGRDLQKKKNKSGVNKVRRKPKKTQKPLLANHLIAEHWDRSQTLTQNYQRLGLTSKLNNPSGGTERQHLEGVTLEDLGRLSTDRLAIKTGPPKEFEVQEARIERDPNTGAIVRVVDGGGAVRHQTAQGPYKALEDSLEALDSMVVAASERYGADRLATADESIVKTLEAQAARPSAPKRRKQSDREQIFIEKLVKRHGTDESKGCYEKMARDQEVNVMQQSAGDLRKRVRKYLKARGELDET